VKPLKIADFQGRTVNLPEGNHHETPGKPSHFYHSQFLEMAKMNCELQFTPE
jgi:hypothetical protein